MFQIASGLHGVGYGADLDEIAATLSARGDGGRERQVLSITKQLDDWRAAIAFARSLPEVDPECICIW
ncbi:MAG: hypothetical protein FJ146_13935 [Deltaproteobacteria bacterium]|nr:hypothetical protein [Deltaproteobacteria bacterium]